MAILCRRQSSECSLSPNIAVTQTVILREHNRIAADLNDLNPHWSDERLYQGTPHWSIARPVAPQKCLIWVYDKNFNSSILKEFYRARLSVTATTWFLESKSKFVLESTFSIFITDTFFFCSLIQSAEIKEKDILLYANTFSKRSKRFYSPVLLCPVTLPFLTLIASPEVT